MEIPKDWIEAGAIAICERAHQHGSWDRVSDDIRVSCMAESHACLAAVFGKASVVYTHTADHECEASLISDDQPIDEKDMVFRKNDTLVIVRGA